TGSYRRVWKVYQVMAHMIVESEIDISWKHARLTGCCGAENVGYARRCRHDGVVSASFLFLVDLIETVSEFVTRTAQVRTGHIALHLVCRRSEKRRVRGRVSIIAKACRPFAGNTDLIVHYASRTTQPGGHHDQMEVPFLVQVSGGIADV